MPKVSKLSGDEILKQRKQKALTGDEILRGRGKPAPPPIPEVKMVTPGGIGDNTSIRDHIMQYAPKQLETPKLETPEIKTPKFDNTNTPEYVKSFLNNNPNFKLTDMGVESPDGRSFYSYGQLEREHKHSQEAEKRDPLFNNAIPGEATIKQRDPGPIQKIKDIGSAVGEKVKAFGYGMGKAAGGDALDRFFSGQLEKQLVKEAEETGNTYKIEKYISDKEFWNDDKLFNSFVGRNIDNEISKADKLTQGAGNVTGDIIQFMTLGSLTGGLTPFNSPILNKILQRGTTGLLSGAEAAYGSGADSKTIIKEAAKSAGFFIAGGAASDKVGNVLIDKLTPIYNKYPQFSKALQAIVATGKGASMGTAGAGAQAALSAIFGDEVNPKEILKTGLTLAAFEGIMSIMTQQPFRPSFELNNKSGIKISKEDSAVWLRKNNYQEFKKGSGIWIKRDPKTGALLDQKNEIVNLNGTNVYKNDIWKAEKALGRTLKHKEIIEFTKNPESFIKNVRGSNKTTPQQKTTEPVKPQETKQGSGDVLLLENKNPLKMDSKASNNIPAIKTPDPVKNEVITPEIEPNQLPGQEKLEVNNEPEIKKKEFNNDDVVEYDGREYKIKGTEGENYIAVNVENGKQTFIPKVISEDLKFKDNRSTDIQMEDRAYENVGSRKVKAYQWENPEVKPYYKSRAEELLEDLKNTQKGERYPIADGEGYSGTPRVTSPGIERIKDQTKASYADIKDALQRIIKDKGQENRALAKRIELMIDDDLVNGYQDYNGNKLPANKGYINVRNKLESKKVSLPKENVDLNPIGGNEQFTNQLQFGIPDDQASMFDYTPEPKKTGEQILEERKKKTPEVKKKELSDKQKSNIRKYDDLDINTPDHLLSREEYIIKQKKMGNGEGARFFNSGFYAAVERAIKQGKKIPEKTMKDFNQLKKLKDNKSSKEELKKLVDNNEHYKLTKEEYLSLFPTDEARKLIENGNSHKIKVAHAIIEGKDVPQKVIDSYPDMDQEVKLRRSQLENTDLSKRKNYDPKKAQEKNLEAKRKAAEDKKQLEDKEYQDGVNERLEVEANKAPIWKTPKSKYVTYKRGPAKELQEYEHKEAVENAINNGEKVPEEVLKEYPELVKKPEPDLISEVKKTIQEEVKKALGTAAPKVEPYQENMEKIFFSMSPRSAEIDAVIEAKPRSVLMSFMTGWNKKTDKGMTIKKAVEKFKENNYNPEIILDSGAYTLYNQGKSPGIYELVDTFRGDGYSEKEAAEIILNELEYLDKSQIKEIPFYEFSKFALENKKYVDYIVALDQIGHADNSFYSYKLMKEMGLNPIPAFHIGSDWSILDKYVELGADYIGLGGAVPLLKTQKLEDRQKVIDFANEAINKYPDIKFHLFGSQDPRVLNEIPELYSADGTTWLPTFGEAAKGDNKVINAIKNIRKKEILTPEQKKINEEYIEESNKDKLIKKDKETGKEIIEGKPVDSEASLSNNPVDRIVDFNKSFKHGEPIKIDDVKDHANYVMENEEAIKAGLSTYKNKELKNMISFLKRNDYTRKDEMVDHIYLEELTDMYLKLAGTNSYSMGYFGYGGPSMEDQFRDKIKGAMENLNQEKLDQLLADKKEAYQAALEKRKQQLEALENPETLEDYIQKKRYKGLSPEEQDTYEDLLAADKKNKRESSKTRQKERNMEKAAEVISNTGKYNIEKSFHTKKNVDIWVVSLKERLPKEDWKPYNDSMKSLGGSYSRYAGGHIFYEDPTSKLEGDIKVEKKEPTGPEKLRETAANMDQKIQDLRADRLENTAKRAKEAAYAREEADSLERIQATMNNIADGIESGDIKLLDKIQHRTEIEQLDSIIRHAHYLRANAVEDQARKEGLHHMDSSKKREAEKRKPIDNETIRHAVLPAEEIFRDTLKRIVLKGLETKGAKQVSKRLMKRINDTKDNYISLSPRAVDDVRDLVKKLKGENSILEEVIKNRNRLEKLGIYTEEELRAYLREYLKYRAKSKGPSKEDQIKAKQRELIGRKIEGYFPTPKKIVDRMLEELNYQKGEAVLEPSAGQGHIADQIGKGNIDVAEWNSANREILELKGHNVIGNDALAITKAYDKIIMNPPFENLQDIDHVMYAYMNNLKPGGRIVSIMSESPFFRKDKKAVEFREWLSEVGYSEKLPEGSFKESDRSTGVNTRIVVIDKPEDAPDPFKGKTPERDKMGIVPPEFRNNTPIDKEFTYNDPELEERHKDNFVKKRAVKERIKEWTDEFKRMSTRTFRDIDPKDPKNAEAFKELVNYPKIKAKSGDEATRIITDIIDSETAGLSTEEYNRFERYVFLKDLQEEVKSGRVLPGLWTPDKVEMELKRLDGALTNNIRKSIEKRKKYMDKLKKDYIAAMEKIGFNAAGKFNKENYFRHQVLEYMDAQRISGSGSKAKVNKNRGYLKERKGSEKDINENYIQAEYEVMAKMLYDTEVAQMYERIYSNYDIKPQLIRKAKSTNEALIDSIIESERKAPLENAAGEPFSAIDSDGQQRNVFNEAMVSETEETIKEFNKMLAISFSKLEKLAVSTMQSGSGIWTDNGRFKDVEKLLIKGIKDNNENNRLYHYLGELAGQDAEVTPGVIEARTILKYTSLKKKFIIETLGGPKKQGGNYYEWDDLIPEGYMEHQPIEGRHFYVANTISEKLADSLIEGVLKDDLTMSDLKVRKMMVVGGDREKFVIPENIGSTLENVYGNVHKDDSAVSKLVSVPMKYWKAWVLTGNPKQVFKYNFRNITGDFDGLITAAGFGSVNPKYVKQAMTEIYDAMKYMRFSPDMLEWRDRGGFQSLLYANEIADLNDMQIFRKFNPESRSSVISKVLPVPKKYFDFTRDATDYREGILRYSAYLFYKDHLKSNGGYPKFYGSSIKGMVDGLNTLEDRAYQLSKDALGAYDEVTETGQAIRKYLYPFYSWVEVNFKRYKRISQNVIGDIKAQEQMGKKMAAALNLPRLAINTIRILGKIGLRMFFLTGTLAIWNNTVMSKYEDKLPEDIKNTPHITLGEDSNGEVRYFSRLGALNDILEWFGFDTISQDIEDLMKERTTLGEVAKEKLIFSPINKIVSGISPFIKTPAELFAGKSFFPDVFNARTIRDPKYYIAQSLGVKDLYKKIAGLPMEEGYLKSWSKAFVYKSDPKVSAYYKVLDLKRKYEKNVLNKYPTQAYNEDPKSQALYYYRQALKYGDQKASDKYLKEYIEKGGTARGLVRSLSMLNPIYGLDDTELLGFIKWLDPEEEKALKLSLQYYSELVNPDSKK